MAETKLKPIVGTAVLGLLLKKPSYGYELVERFNRAFAAEPGRWRVTPTAIYNALGTLEREHLIERVAPESGEAEPAQRMARQDFRVTAEGARAMREWLAEPMSSDPTDEELLIRLHVGGGDATLRDMLRLHTAECLQALEEVAKLPGVTRHERLVKEHRRLALQSRLSWIDFALAELRGPGDEPIRAVGEAR